MADIFDFTDEWDDVGTTFNAVKADVTDTNSAAASNLINLLVDSGVKYRVQKDGATFQAGDQVFIGATNNLIIAPSDQGTAERTATLPDLGSTDSTFAFLEQDQTFTGAQTFASGTTIGNLTLADGSITDSSGAIDFGNESLTTTGVITGATLEATGDTSAGDNAAAGYTASEGLILTGQGSSNDVTIKNDADAEVASVPTGTQHLALSGDLRIGSGGIDFSGSGTAANIMDDYEEGTWTPDLSDGTNNDATQDISQGNYTLTGREVTASVRIDLSSLGSLSGVIEIEGLPHTAAGSGNYHGGPITTAAGLNITAGHSVFLRPVPNGDVVQIYVWDQSDGPSRMTAAELSADGALQGKFGYAI